MERTLAGQYLTFKVGKEEYGVNIHKIKEVLEYREPVRTPYSPTYIAGVINLRGQAVTVTDLRIKFGVSYTEPTVDTCIIIFETGGEDALSLSGALADSVLEVAEFTEDEIEPAPDNHEQQGIITGLARKDSGFIMLLDAEKLFINQDGPAGLANRTVR